MIYLTLILAFTAAAHAALPPSYPTVEMRGREGSNIRMPLIGIGTWLYNDTVAEEAVKEAFSANYRHVDTALSYNNQRGVGRALAASNVPRSEYFVTSKIPGATEDSANATYSALEQCLEQLNLEYVDLMLIHWPGKTTTKRGRQTQWKALESWAKAGKARAIGISHYCKTHVEEVLEVAELPIALAQNQYHVGMGHDTQAHLHDKAFMEEEGILYMAYSSLCGPCPNGGSKELIDGPLVTSIGKKYGKSGAQVSLRWVVQQGIPVIPKSSNPAHIASNFDLFDFSLTAEDMAKLTSATSPPETGTAQQPDDAQDCTA